ncbi:hypothetical protein K1719_047029 [Acacia pycnantha]|nr:hypothetical protein K1719_047029 [Acacia pycnantha]
MPMDGPMSFSTPRVSVQWVLRFEFYATPKNLDCTKCEHLLLIEEEKNVNGSFRLRCTHLHLGLLGQEL